MSRKNYDIDALFEEPAAVAAQSSANEAQSVVAPASMPKPQEDASKPIVAQSSANEAQPIVAPASMSNPDAAPKTGRTQKAKVSRSEAKQVGKHTFEFPNDLWADFEILLFALQQQGRKKTQNGFITELLQAAVEENKPLINRFK